MKMINEDHVHITAELRTPSGEMLTVCDLRADSFHHPTKDLAVMHFLHNTHSLNTFQQLKFHCLDIEPYSAAEGEVSLVCGGEMTPLFCDSCS